MIFLSEFLFRIFYVLLSFVACFVITFYYHPFFIQLFLQYNKYNGAQIVFLSIFESLQCAINISFYLSFICLIPYLFYTIWHWFTNAIFEKERSFLNTFIGLSFMNFLFIQLLGIFLIYPQVLNFLSSFQFPNIINQFSLIYFLNSFLAIQLLLIFLFSLANLFLFLIFFQFIPLTKTLRKWASFILLLIAAIICPPDLVSQFTVWIFCQMIFEIFFFFGYILKHYQYKYNKMIEEHLNIEENTDK